MFQYENHSFTKLINYSCETPCIEIAHLWHLNSDAALHMSFKAQVKTRECIFWKEKKATVLLAFTLQRLLHRESKRNILNDNFNMRHFNMFPTH